MSASTKIEWTGATWNPVTGCAKVSPGCKHCYAESYWPRLQHLPAYSGRAFTDVRCHADRLDQPLRWKNPRRIFVNSMSDLFHPDVPDDFIDKVFAVMAIEKTHVFQVLTKRPKRMRAYFESLRYGRDADDRGYKVIAWADAQFGITSRQVDLIGQTPKGLQNVWLGVSVEDQATAGERIPLLLQTPAAVRWVSAEPLLGPVTLCLDRLREWNVLAVQNGQPWAAVSIDWVVVGCESGPKARPMNPDWARSLRAQCAAEGVAFFMKQISGDRGKVINEISMFPEDLRIREYPNSDGKDA